MLLLWQNTFQEAYCEHTPGSVAGGRSQHIEKQMVTNVDENSYS